MKNDLIRPNVLSVKIISNVSPEMAKKLELEPHHKSLGLITADCDDVTYTALDEATKAAEVDVVYARSMYAGAGNEDDSICYYAQCVSRTGSYLSKTAGIREGEALAYLVAPPLEAMYALDAALKAADVEMCEFFAPPTETNFAGALLTGSQSACKAACDAFAEAVQSVASNPLGF